MSGTASQLALLSAHRTPLQGRSPLAHLLHALNQPLTGLQCSLELAVAGPRPTEQYIRALREGLELTHRMRILVEAIRELADDPPSASKPTEPLLRLDALLRDTVDDLLPVATAKGVQLLLRCSAALPVRADRQCLAKLIFRFLESALSLTEEGSDLRVDATLEQQHACLVVSWNQGPLPEYSPFSRQELGLLIAQSGWEQAGAEWSYIELDMRRTYTIRLLLSSPCPNHDSADLED